MKLTHARRLAALEAHDFWNKETSDEKLYSVSATAFALGVSRNRIRELPIRRIPIGGNRFAYRRGDVLQFYFSDVIAPHSLLKRIRPYDWAPRPQGPLVIGRPIEDGSRTKLKEAEDWLYSRLDECLDPVDSREIIREAMDAGFSERTIQRARKSLCVYGMIVVVTQTGFGANKRSLWSMEWDEDSWTEADEKGG
jgi:hypothetical protein